MELLLEYGLFLAKAITVVAAIGILILLGATLSMRNRGSTEGYIELRKLNDRYRDMQDAIREATTDPALHKEAEKARKKAEKKENKQKVKDAKRHSKHKDEDTPDKPTPNLFVLDFDGDMRASAVDNLREEISALLMQIGEDDEVLLRLESGGGMVHSYGLASSQLQRIHNAGRKLTVAVDKVAASGGYMMACVGDQIIAAPFAILGSIGVLAQLPNFHRLLKKNEIDFELFTAGEYKRTLTLFGENTDKGREKFREELEDTHDLFKEFVKANRDSVDVDRVATGEVWYGQRALEVNLVDSLQTSDDYIQEKLNTHSVLELRYRHRKNWQEKLGISAEGALERSFLKLWQAAHSPPPQ